MIHRSDEVSQARQVPTPFPKSRSTAVYEVTRLKKSNDLAAILASLVEDVEQHFTFHLSLSHRSNNVFP
jgi:hypothetical protein